MKLEVSGLSKSFGAQTVLNHISFGCDAVHCLVLIGPSGGGKSTLLRILAGLERPDGGAISWDGEPMRFDEPSLLKYRRSVGTVFQGYNLFPHLTALQNITLPLEQVHGCSPGEARKRAHALLERFDLAGHEQKKPAHLSGGQQQRIAIARALAIQPRVVFLDEPTSALDPEMTAEVLEMIAEIKTSRRDLVLVTHQMGFARRIGDRIAFLAGGRISEIGTPEEVMGSPRTEPCRRFLSQVLRY